MRKFKIVMFSALCVALAGVLGVGVVAAVYLNINISGKIEYSSTEIGARIWGTTALNTATADGTAEYLQFSSSTNVTDNVYYIQGEEESYSNILANTGTVNLSDKTDSFEIFVFLKNVGDRYIIPTINISVDDPTLVVYSTVAYYFDISEGHPDPLNTKTSSASADAFITSVKSEITSGNYSSFGMNSSIDNSDVYVAKITFALADSVPGNNPITIASGFDINISFMADVQYTSNDILSVYQDQGQTDPAWTKFGYNATLTATPTQIEENNLSNLQYYLTSAGGYGATGTAYTLSDVYTESAPVYSEIDIVNVDVATGEIIGKLSDPNYNFEWYGREITLPQGTTLASGRVLTEAESFTVDVYTYYPTMYIRRWVVGNRQWISLSDTTFAGAVEIEEYYTGTFEATICNPDKTVAENEYGVYTRSYLSNYTPLAGGSQSVQEEHANYTNSFAYLEEYYGFEESGLASTVTTQTSMLSWANNLTEAWQNSALESEYRTALGVQGENYTAYIFNLLYLVKYANNNSQEMVGYGNTDTASIYSSSFNATTITTESGAQIFIGVGSESAESRYESQKGSGTIGVYNSSQRGTATYSQENGVYRLSADGFDDAGMNYGYNVNWQFEDDPEGLYAPQFLTYNNGTKKYLTDGYVGSDCYTSVFCLGQANPWGNVYTWIFGSAIHYEDTGEDNEDGTNIYRGYAYINFDNYDYNNSPSTWMIASNSKGFNSNNTDLTEQRGYIRLSYNTPAVSGNYYYTHYSTSAITSSTGIEMLVGLPSADTATTSGTTTGTCDQYYTWTVNATNVFGVLRGGPTNSNTLAGAFHFAVNNRLSNAYESIGFRPSLIS